MICSKDRIVIAKSQQLQVVSWYHNFLGHPGINRTEEPFGQKLLRKDMCKHITLTVNSCVNCQENKCSHKKYGQLPKRETEAIPWVNMCMDLIGPYINWHNK